jgi:hypothetical protein
VRRSLSSHLMWRGATLHIWCGKESLFTFDVGSSHSSHSESLFKLAVERVTFHIWCGEDSLFMFQKERSHSSGVMWRGVTLHIWCEE